MKKIITLIFLCVFPVLSYSHSSWKEHVADMFDIFGFEEVKKAHGNGIIQDWGKFISSEMIDQYDSDGFYTKLKNLYPGFSFGGIGDHRVLFHWGFDSEPWSTVIEEIILNYCDSRDLNADTYIRIFQTEFKEEQRKRNTKITDRTESVFHFGSRKYTRAFCSLAYNIHLIGDYTSDNTNLKGLQDLDKIVASINRAIKDLDPMLGKDIIKGLERLCPNNNNPQRKADDIMIYLKREMPSFIKKAQNGSIKRLLESKGFKLK